MKTIILTLLFYYFYFISLSQNLDNKVLFKLVGRDTAKVTINITIPTIEFTDTVNIPEYSIQMKYSIMTELNYVTKQKNKLKSNQCDTLFIATYNKGQWKGVDPKYAESSCNLQTEPCSILLAEPGIYLIRFRCNTKTKTYKLVIKE